MVHFFHTHGFHVSSPGIWGPTAMDSKAVRGRCPEIDWQVAKVKRKATKRKEVEAKEVVAPIVQKRKGEGKTRKKIVKKKKKAVQALESG